LDGLYSAGADVSKTDLGLVASQEKLAAIYVTRLPKQVDVASVASPFDVKEVVAFLSPHATRRLAVQSGVFTVHPKPDKDWDDDGIERLVLRFTRNEWLNATRRLLRFGVHRYTLFPDLDGLSGYLQFLYTRGFSLQLAPIASID
jgi:hypothetical protein